MKNIDDIRDGDILHTKYMCILMAFL